MKDHHRAWLECHPHRSEEWLLQKLAEGFDVHHVDGNHENNAYSNLVLIEGSDHFMLHAGGKRTNMYRAFLTQEEQEEKLAQAAEAYGLRSEGNTWATVAGLLGLSEGRALSLAQKHAARNGLTWPVQVPVGTAKAFNVKRAA